jgi:hypothetical protein
MRMILTLSKKLAVLGALAVALICATSTNAYATHFRYGTITWTVPNPVTAPNVVQVSVELAFRRSFFSPLPTVGVPVAVGSDVIVVQNVITNAIVQQQSLVLTPTSINPSEDWFVGTMTFTVAFPVTSTPTAYKVSYSQCCRISTLNDNNHDQNYIVWTQFTLDTHTANPNHPPVASSIPIIRMGVNRPFSFRLPATDADGDPITYRLAATTESGLVAIKPAEPASGPGVFTLNGATGVMTWTPTVLGLYAVQVVMTDTHGASTVVDVVLEVITANGSAPALKLNVVVLATVVEPPEPAKIGLPSAPRELATRRRGAGSPSS